MAPAPLRFNARHARELALGLFASPGMAWDFFLFLRPRTDAAGDKGAVGPLPKNGPGVRLRECPSPSARPSLHPWNPHPGAARGFPWLDSHGQAAIFRRKTPFVTLRGRDGMGGTEPTAEVPSPVERHSLGYGPDF